MSRRATYHNGRKGKNGVYNPEHNDRSFLDEEERPNENFYWHCLQSVDANLNFEEVEKIFYDDRFRDGLDFQNAKHKKARNHKRIKTMDEYRTSSMTCPEESLIYLGNIRDIKKGLYDELDPNLFQEIMLEQLSWEQETYPNVQYLDYGIHVDEDGAIHGHARKVWIGHDEQGNEIVSQNGALNEMGIERPDLTKKKGRYNNPKQTYTKQVREHFISVAQQYGLEIETEPREKSKQGLEQDEYIAQQIHEDVENLTVERENLFSRINTLKTNKNSLQGEITALESERKEVQDEIAETKEQKDEEQTKLENLFKKVDIMTRELGKRQSDLKRVNDELNKLGSETIDLFYDYLEEHPEIYADLTKYNEIRLARQNYEEAEEKVLELDLKPTITRTKEKVR